MKKVTATATSSTNSRSKASKKSKKKEKPKERKIFGVNISELIPVGTPPPPPPPPVKRKPIKKKIIKVKKKPVIKLTRIDHTAIWSRLANGKRRFNPMDPDPDPPMDFRVRELPKPSRNKDGQVILDMKPEDWKQFWLDRIRRHYKVEAPNLTDNEVYATYVRSRRIFLRGRANTQKPHIDPDLPPCYYWDKFQVAQWFESLGFPDSIKEMVLQSDISGRRLILVNSSSLVKVGFQDPNLISEVTAAVRILLGLPPPNGLRAMMRQVPLEQFLYHKIRTGLKNDKFTFKEFCAQEGIDYEGATVQKNQGYKKVPCTIKVTIKPHEDEKVDWLGTLSKPKAKKTPREKLPYYPFRPTAEDDIHLSCSEESGSSDGLASDDEVLDVNPTVEELAVNAMYRNQLIPEILSEIVAAIFTRFREKNAIGKCRQELADQILKERMQQTYSNYNITDPEERLKLVTLIAEELVDDVTKAKEILEDIDTLQQRIHKDVKRNEMLEIQEAVAHYVQDIMPHVVSAALKEMRESENNLRAALEEDSDDDDFVNKLCVLKAAEGLASSSSSEESDLDISTTPTETKSLGLERTDLTKQIQIFKQFTNRK